MSIHLYDFVNEYWMFEDTASNFGISDNYCDNRKYTDV